MQTGSDVDSMPEGFSNSDGIYTPCGMPAGGRDLITKEYEALCMRNGRRRNMPNNSPFQPSEQHIHRHNYYELAVLSVPNTKKQRSGPHVGPHVIVSYWTTKKEEKIKKCIEKFDEILQRENRCEKRSEQAAVRRAKKQECREKKRQKTK